jgi:hypothetical protein
MTDDIRIDPDPINDAGIRVREEGGCFIMSVLSFAGGPIGVRFDIPKRNAVKELHRYIRTLIETEDVYAALLADHIAEHQPAAHHRRRSRKRNGARKPLTDIRLRRSSDLF